MDSDQRGLERYLRGIEELQAELAKEKREEWKESACSLLSYSGADGRPCMTKE